MEERRRHPRSPTRLNIRFRIVREDTEPEMSELVEGKIRDLSIEGLAMESPVIVADGLHISYNDHPSQKNRIYLQWDLPGDKSIKAIGETMWFERIGGARPIFVVGIRFVEISKESLQLLRDFLEVSSGGRPVSL